MLDFATGLSHGYGGQYYFIRKLAKDISRNGVIKGVLHIETYATYDPLPQNYLITQSF